MSLAITPAEGRLDSEPPSAGTMARAAVTADLYAALLTDWKFGPTAVGGETAEWGPPFQSVNEAIALFEGSAPDSAMARVNDRILVRLHRAAERYDEAAARLERLIASSTDDGERVDLLFELGELHQVTGNAARARRAYEQALEYDSDNWIVLNNLAYLLSDDFSEFEAARPLASRAVAIADNATTLDTLGWIYVGLGDYLLAIAELGRALRLNPSDTLTYYHLGEAYRRAGHFSVAANILRSGRDLARTADNPERVARPDASLKRVARSDRAP